METGVITNVRSSPHITRPLHKHSRKLRIVWHSRKLCLICHARYALERYGVPVCVARRDQAMIQFGRVRVLALGHFRGTRS